MMYGIGNIFGTFPNPSYLLVIQYLPVLRAERYSIQHPFVLD